MLSFVYESFVEFVRRNQQVVFGSQFREPSKQFAREHGSGRVAGRIYDHHLRARSNSLFYRSRIGQKALFRAAHAEYRRTAGLLHMMLVEGKERLQYERFVARIEAGLHGQIVRLTASCRDKYRINAVIEAVAPPPIAGNGLAQFRPAHARRIVRIAREGGFRQFLANVARRRQIRLAERKVNAVPSVRGQGCHSHHRGRLAVAEFFGDEAAQTNLP